MRSLLIMLLSCAYGCTLETPAPTEQGEEESLGTAPSALACDNAAEPNSLTPNGMIPNGMIPNGLIWGALTPSTIPPCARTALADSGEAGRLSRMFLKYAVSCAFDRTQVYTTAWRGADGVDHLEIYRGSVGLAPEWQSVPLAASKQRWVSACMFARTNYFGTSVMVSARGTVGALGADADERSTFPIMEGAFWGNLFTIVPSAYACHIERNRHLSIERGRVCAAGMLESGSPVSCGPIRTRGECSLLCTRSPDAELGFTVCDGASEVVTTFLQR